MQDIFVFQGVTYDGPTRKIQKSSSLSKQLTNAAQRASMANIIIQDNKHEVIVKTNSKALILL
jgi:hypothetical protein